MQREESRGIVLRSIDYRQRQRIITLLTEEKGLISLIVKGLGKKQAHLFSLTSPFSVGEFHYTIHRSDLYSLRDAAIIQTHLDLRERLSSLEAASEIVNALLSSQLPGKPAPLLYRLTLSYFRQIPLFDSPSNLVASFLLKLLRHEGVLSQERVCTSCGSPATHLALGEPFCSSHSPYQSPALSELEWEQFFILLQARDFLTIKKLEVPPDLLRKIKASFEEKFAYSAKAQKTQI